MPRPPSGWSELRWLLTSDGVRVCAVHRTGPLGSGVGPAYVLAHGFTGTWQSAGLRGVAEELSRTGGVVAFDFRGHGRSGGSSTVGDREVLDLDAAVHWARLLGYDRVVTIGFSMGASVAVRHAALLRGIDAVVSVSGPARWFYRGTPAMRRVHLAIERPAGRVVSRVALHTRIGNARWDPAPTEPRVLARLVAPIPLLVVHGDHDRYFPIDHGLELAAAAGPTSRLWLEPGFGHAEASISRDLTRRIAAWAQGALAAAPVDAAIVDLTEPEVPWPTG